jgi:hypothetical protein
MESVIETHANSILQWSNIDENTTQYREHLLDQPFASGLPAICALPFFLRHLPGV